MLTTPALALLKAHRPDLKISVIVEPRFRAVFEGNPDIDEIRESACAAVLAVNFHGGTRSMLLTAATRARIRCGFAHHRYGFVYSHKIPRAQEILGVERRVHTAEHLASAVFWLGVPQTEIPRAKLFAPESEVSGSYFVIHPFASAPDKTWPAARFVEIAKRARCVFLAGPEDDVRPLAGFEVLKNAPLDRVKSLISGAQLFIGNDSGPAHIAAAFGVPVVVLFGASDPVTWAPWRTEAQVLASREGIGGISLEDVLAAIETLKVRV